MAHAIARVADPLLTIDTLQSWLNDLQTIIEAAGHIDGEDMLTPDRARFVVAGLVQVARRMVEGAQADINAFNLATIETATGRKP